LPLTTMPRSTNPVAFLEAGHAITNGSDITDEFVAQYDGKGIAEKALLSQRVGTAHTTCEHLDENLTGSRLLELELLDLKGSVCAGKDGRFVGLGEGWHFGDVFVSYKNYFRLRIEASGIATSGMDVRGF
jgi:hypothetical protein